MRPLTYEEAHAAAHIDYSKFVTRDPFLGPFYQKGLEEALRAGAISAMLGLDPQRNQPTPPQGQPIKKGATVLISGSRSLSLLGETALVNLISTSVAKLEAVRHFSSITRIIHGGATGVDTAAGVWAKKNGITVDVCAPEYDAYPGKVAPLKRNDVMVAICHAAVFIWDGRSGGTRYTIDAVHRAEKPYTVLRVEGETHYRSSEQTLVGANAVWHSRQWGAE